MIGLLEISLAIAAWRKGWGPKALLPLVGAVAFGVLLGCAALSIGAPTAQFRGIGLLADAGCIIALSRMARRKPAASTCTVAPATQASAAVQA